MKELRHRVFRRRWRAEGLSDEAITHKWAEFWVVEGYRDSLERKGIEPAKIGEMVREFESEMIRNRKWGR